MKSENGLHILNHFRTYQQTSSYTCGCGCIIMALDYLTHQNSTLNESYCAEIADIGTDIHNNSYGKLGAPPQSIENALITLGYETISNRNVGEMPFNDELSFKNWAIQMIDQGYPIIVHHMDWGGHYLVIIGIDTMETERTKDDIVIVADPSDSTDHRQDGYNIWGLENFIVYGEFLPIITQVLI
ncbi:Peptidase C39 family protein [Histomonas meleagridis]|nr:Peptidase C39 family protein [Histomonas meleagridis]